MPTRVCCSADRNSTSSQLQTSRQLPPFKDHAPLFYQADSDDHESLPGGRRVYLQQVGDEEKAEVVYTSSPEDESPPSTSNSGNSHARLLDRIKRRLSGNPAHQQIFEQGVTSSKANRKLLWLSKKKQSIADRPDSPTTLRRHEDYDTDAHPLASASLLERVYNESHSPRLRPQAGSAANSGSRACSRKSNPPRGYAFQPHIKCTWADFRVLNSNSEH